MSGRTDVDGYVPGHGDPSYDVTHYDLELTYKVEGNLLDGDATADAASPSTDLDRLALDLHGLRVAQGRRRRRRGQVHRTDGTSSTCAPRSPVAQGDEFEVVVQYAGHPSPAVEQDASAARAGRSSPTG